MIFFRPVNYGLTHRSGFAKIAGMETPKCAAAVELGRMAKGRKKHYTVAQIKRLKARLAEARRKRWPKNAATYSATSSEKPVHPETPC